MSPVFRVRGGEFHNAVTMSTHVAARPTTKINHINSEKVKSTLE